MTIRYPCPCCNYLTYEDIPPQGEYEICPVCYWEDDPVQSKDQDYTGGANEVSLNQAKKNFFKYGAISESLKKYTRLPKKNEK